MKSGRIVLFVLSCFAAAASQAQALRPTVNKSFSPSTVAVNQISTLTITLNNPNATALIGASIQDNYPAGLVNTAPLNASLPTTCGSGTAFNQGNAISFVNGTIPANGSCTITATVIATAPNTYVNSTGAVFTSGPSSLTGATATLVVFAPIATPALSTWALLLLAALIAAIALSRL